MLPCTNIYIQDHTEMSHTAYTESEKFSLLAYDTKFFEYYFNEVLWSKTEMLKIIL